MPLYEYRCKKCDHRFEKIQKFSDPLVKKCPKCNGRVEQMISSPAVHFKGTGWYVTDYGGKDKSKEEKSKEEKPKEDGTAKPEAEKPKDKKKDSNHKDTKDTKEAKETKKKTDS